MRKLFIILLTVSTILSCERNEMFEFANTGHSKLEITPGDGELYLSWSPVEDAVAYEIWYNTTDDPYSAYQFGGSDITVTNYTIAGLSNGTMYYVWIKMLREAGGTSLIIASGSGTPSTVPLTVLAPPDLPTAAPIASMLILTWNAVPGATAYEVWYSATSNSLDAVQQGGDITTTNYTLSGLSSATSYYFWIKAKNETLTSPYSPMGTGTTL